MHLQSTETLQHSTSRAMRNDPNWPTKPYPQYTIRPSPRMSTNDQWTHQSPSCNEVFTLPHSFRAVPLGNSHICSECSISEVRANFRNSSEFFRAYSDQFRATGRNHSDMIRTYSEQIPSKFRSYPSILIRAIPNKDQ